MTGGSIEAVVAGHLCLDVIPQVPAAVDSLDKLLVPGKLTNVGPVVISTGGAVSNTGIALHRLGIPTRLMGKIGDDFIGRAILDVIRGYGNTLPRGMIIDGSVSSSYTLVLNPPGVDRMFLHYPGANDAFGAGDIDIYELHQARLFHFGYPPILRRMYQENGDELVQLFSAVKTSGVTTSLDMAYPDPESEAGQADWPAILKRVLPYVDVFLPSLDEMLFLLRHLRSRELQEKTAAGESFTYDDALLREISETLLDMGAALVVLKLGDQGLYLRTTDQPKRLAAAGEVLENRAGSWLGRELYAPCFRVEVAGTTGAGDATIAGFLAGLLRGAAPEATMTTAVGVGAFNVEHPDALSGIPDWDAVRRRIAGGWEQLDVSIGLTGWTLDAETHLWNSSTDGDETAGSPSEEE